MTRGPILEGVKELLRVGLESWFPSGFAALAHVADRMRLGRGEPEQALLPLLCDTGEAAVDVGANHGSYTVALLPLATRVFAVEANPKLAYILRARVAAAVREGRVVVLELALSGASGEIDLFVPDDAPALASVEPTVARRMPGHVVHVPCDTLDRLDLPRIGFIKIDVEGHEEEVLAGGAGLIARDRPTLLVEAEERHRPGSLRRIRERLEAAGYRGFFLSGGRLRPVAEFDAAAMQNRSALNEAGTHRRSGSIYINNFVFVARDGVIRALADARWLPSS
ncbi:MAG: FkbM family methyltransferase [Alphaproteobacteria bacterium]|nr:FkbM family methyltransferase [Alphaproteobacteria bacterium]